MIRKICLVLIMCCCAFGQRPFKPPLGWRVNWNDSLARDLFACWPMNERQGTLLYDESGNSHRAVALNGISWTADGDIDLSDQELLVKYSYPVAEETSRYGGLSMLGNSYTIMWSCVVDDISTDHVGIVSQWGTSTAYREWATVYIQATGELRFYADGGASNNTASGTAVTVGVRDSRAIVFAEGSHVDFYKDGEYEQTNAFAFTPTLVTPRRAVLGAWGNDGAAEVDPIFEFRGTMKYMYIFKRELSADEIRTLYNDPYQIFQPPFNYSLYIGLSGAVPSGGMGTIMTIILD